MDFYESFLGNVVVFFCRSFNKDKVDMMPAFKVDITMKTSEVYLFNINIFSAFLTICFHLHLFHPLTVKSV